MANYTIPGQNLTYEIPDEGQVFRSMGTRAGENNPIYKRVGNQIYQITATQASGTNPGKTAGQQYEETYGAGSFDKISQYNMADAERAFQQLGFSYQTLNDLNQFNPGGPVTPGESYTQNVQANNPNAASIISNTTGKQVNPVAPSAQQALMNGGASQQQAQQLAGNMQPVNSPSGQAVGAVPNNLSQTANGVNPAQAMTNGGGAPAVPGSAMAGAQPQAVIGYQGGSIVDYLNSIGAPSDFSSRNALAQQYGMPNYTGTASQNTQLLNSLRSHNPTASSGGPTSGQSGITSYQGASGGMSGASTQSDNAGGNPADPYSGLSPIEKQVKMYTDTYKALGLNTIKEQQDKYTKDQLDLTNKMNDEIAEVNSNPWLSEGIRVKEAQKLKDKYATRLDTLTNLLNLTDSLYKQGQAQVENIVSGANADIKATNDLAQKQIDAASALAKDNQVVTIGNQEVLINKLTGKTVAVLGPSKVVGTGDDIPKFTEYQGKSADFALRMKSTNDIIDSLTNKGFNPAGVDVIAQSKLPTTAQSEEVQKYIQASREFIAAILRRDTGAAVTPAEFELYYPTYFAGLGEAPGTIEQKRVARQRAQSAAQATAGKAYDYVEKVYIQNTANNATQTLDGILNQQTPSVTTNPTGFFDQFLGMFGLQTAK